MEYVRAAFVVLIYIGLAAAVTIILYFLLEERLYALRLWWRFKATHRGRVKRLKELLDDIEKGEK